MVSLLINSVLSVQDCTLHARRCAKIIPPPRWEAAIHTVANHILGEALMQMELTGAEKKDPISGLSTFLKKALKRRRRGVRMVNFRLACKHPCLSLAGSILNGGASPQTFSYLSSALQGRAQSQGSVDFVQVVTGTVQ